MLQGIKAKKIQILIAIIGLGLGFGGGKYYHYTATPRYVLDKAKQGCLKNDMKAFAKGAYIFERGETRPLTSEQIEKLAEAGECPYKELFNRKISQTRSSAATIQTLGVEDAVRFGFEGSDKIIRAVRKDGGWHILLVGETN